MEILNLVSHKGDVKKDNCNLTLKHCGGNYEITGGSIIGTIVIGTVKTTTGKVDLSRCNKLDIMTDTGAVYLENCNVQNVYSNGKVVLSSSTVQKLYAEHIQGIGAFVTTLILPKTKKPLIEEDQPKFNILKPNTWFTKTAPVEDADKFIVPDGVTIQNIQTDRTVISKYPINIIGDGKLVIE